MKNKAPSFVLIAGTWIQMRDTAEEMERTVLLLKTVTLKDPCIPNNAVALHVWCPINGNTFNIKASCVTQTLGTIQFPTPDRSVHLRVDPSQR